MKLLDKTAIVTGSGQLIGRAIALRLAEEGANVIVDDIEIDRASKVAEEIKKLGRNAIAIQADVTNSEDVKRMVDLALTEFGKIDILVNNVGGSARLKATLFCESTEDVWDFVINKNLKSVLYCTRSIINHMIQRKSGRIINISSISGIVGQSGTADYCAAKGGVISFTMALAKEVVPHGITVNCVSPGSIGTTVNPSYRIKEDSEKTGMNRLGKPEEVAGMVAFLASDDASFITGQNVAVCGLENLGYYAYFKH